jgi:hypothetical protein
VFGVAALIGLTLAVWAGYRAFDTLRAMGSIKGGTLVEKAATSTVKAVTPEEREQSVILPYASIPAEGLTLYLPNKYKNIRGIGYHESSHTRAIPMTPIGRLLVNDNYWDTDVELTSNLPLPTYNIMETRGEYATATTVADIAMDPDTPVLAPVSGIVIKIEPKIIYDEFDDVQIEMIPDGHANLRVAFLHIDNIKVKAGDHLVQGKTVMGIPKDWRGRIDAELDDYVKPPMPHVHIQVNRPEQQ